MMAPWSGIVVLAMVDHRPTETFGGDARTSRKRPWVDGREPGLQSVLRTAFALSTPRVGEQWTRIAILASASWLLSARFVNGERSTILVDLTHAFPVSVGDAVALITDTRNWKAFLPNFVRLHDPTRIKRDTLVDKVTVVIRLPSRDVQGSTMLGMYEQDSRVPYVSRQKGLPDAQHERHFKAAPEGFAFRPVVVFEPRSGLADPVERFVERAAPGALRKSMEGLEVDFGQQRSRA